MSIASSKLWKSEAGLTLVELIITMGLSSLLIVILVSGSIFIQKYLSQWRQQGSLTEDLIYVQKELHRAFSQAKTIHTAPDSLVVVSTNGSTTTYSWLDGQLSKDEVLLLPPNMRVHSLAITEFTLTNQQKDDILAVNMGGGLHTHYRIALVLEGERGRSDSVSFLVRHTYAYFKHKTTPAVSLSR